MQFISIKYILFFSIVFFLFSILDLKIISLLLLLSLFFYGAGNGFLLIIPLLLSIIGNYFIGLYLKKNKTLLYFAWVWNIGFIVAFKYLFVFYFRNEGYIIPLGISYFSLQSLSYCIDVYNGSVKPERNFLLFSTYISFFPQLIIGPIERATNLLPQLKNWNTVKFNYKEVTFGFRLILTGIFMKVVLANRLSEITNPIFDDFNSFKLSICYLGSMLYALQLYFDFGGYSYIAIGSAKTLGINLSDNFKFPFFSTSITEFWKRWHISITQWFNDYIFNPVFSNLRKLKLQNPNFRYIISVTFTLVLLAFWHFFSISFLITGIIQAFFLILEFLTKPKNKVSPIFGRIYTFLVFSFTLTFFKIQNVEIIKIYIYRLLHFDFKGLGAAELSVLPFWSTQSFQVTIILILVFFYYEFNQFMRKQDDLIHSFPTFGRWIVYAIVVVLIFIFGIFTDNAPFIYKDF